MENYTKKDTKNIFEISSGPVLCSNAHKINSQPKPLRQK